MAILPKMFVTKKLLQKKSGLLAALK